MPVLHILQTFLNIVGSFEMMASANTEAFKYAVLNAIKTSGNGVSPLRINNLQVIFKCPLCLSNMKVYSQPKTKQKKINILKYA